MQYEATVRWPITSDIVKRVSKVHAAAIFRRAEVKDSVAAGAKKERIPPLE